MVLQYAEGGNFNNWTNNNYKNFNWNGKIIALSNILCGLKEFHQKQLVHRDFHTGNILVKSTNWTCISDMGLCGEVGNTDETKIYGVMPYMAPEVLRGQPYTQTADIYSFGMIMYFTATGRQPFSDRAHDQYLALDICNRIRPEISEPEAPKCYIDLMRRCWDSNPNNRPKATELHELFRSFYNSYSLRQDDEIEKQFKEAEKYREASLSLSIENNRQTTHPQAIYTSRLLNPFTKDLPKYDSECLDCAITD
jgi:serine/threonine protein kinase